MTHDERVYHHLYETNEGIAEQSERIASLEELVLDLRTKKCKRVSSCRPCPHYGTLLPDRCDLDVRTHELGVKR